MPQKRRSEPRWKPTAFGRYIKAHRERLEWSQAKMGSEVGVDPTYISQLENGRLPAMSLDFLDRLARVFGISTETLITEGQLPRRNVFRVDPELLTASRQVLLHETRHLTDEQVARLAQAARALFGPDAPTPEGAEHNLPDHSSPSAPEAPAR